MTFGFDGLHPALHGFVSNRGITVAVRHAGVDWDLIFDADIKPKRVRRGYLCELCDLGSPRVFANRWTLFANHLGEPFLQWTNDKLAKAQWLVLKGIPDRVTVAELTINLPIWTPGRSSEWTTQVMSLTSPFNEKIVP